MMAALIPWIVGQSVLLLVLLGAAAVVRSTLARDPVAEDRLLRWVLLLAVSGPAIQWVAQRAGWSVPIPGWCELARRSLVSLDAQQSESSTARSRLARNVPSRRSSAPPMPVSSVAEGESVNSERSGVLPTASSRPADAIDSPRNAIHRIDRADHPHTVGAERDRSAVESGPNGTESIGPTDAITVAPAVSGAGSRSRLRLTANATGLLYLAGVGIGLGWWGLRRWRTRRLLVRSRPIADPRWLDSWRRLANPRERRRVRLRGTDRLQTPACTGWLRPTLLVPSGSRWELEAEAVRWALLHELEHLRRRDPLWTALEDWFTALHWFHPAAWWLRARARVVRECACDRQVVGRHGQRRRSYALALLTFADRGPSTTMPALLHWRGERSTLERRIEMLIQSERMVGRRVRWIATAGLLGSVAITQSALAAFQQDTPPENPSKETAGCGQEDPAAVAARLNVLLQDAACGADEDPAAVAARWNTLLQGASPDPRNNIASALSRIASDPRGVWPQMQDPRCTDAAPETEPAQDLPPDQDLANPFGAAPMAQVATELQQLNRRIEALEQENRFLREQLDRALRLLEIQAGLRAADPFDTAEFQIADPVDDFPVSAESEIPDPFLNDLAVAEFEPDPFLADGVSLSREAATLLNKLASGDAPQRWETLDRIGTHGELLLHAPPLVDAVVAAVGDADAFVQCRAIDVLCQLEVGSPKAVAALSATLGDADTVVRRAAFDALRQLDSSASLLPAELGVALERDARVSEGIVNTLEFVRRECGGDRR